MSVLVFDIQNQFVVTRSTRKGDNSASYQMSTPTCPHVCSFEGCEKTFSRRDRLLIHLRTHTGEVRLKNCHIIYVVYIFNMKQARPWMMNARESENYLNLAISRSSSASKSVEIFWAEIYRGDDFFKGRI